jgi:hypothetical protein
MILTPLESINEEIKSLIELYGFTRDQAIIASYCYARSEGDFLLLRADEEEANERWTEADKLKGLAREYLNYANKQA